MVLLPLSIGLSHYVPINLSQKRGNQPKLLAHERHGSAKVVNKAKSGQVLRPRVINEREE
jgi:hypothetical protein